MRRVGRPVGVHSPVGRHAAVTELANDLARLSPETRRSTALGGRLLIDGALVPARDGGTITVTDPSSGKAFTHFAAASADDVADADAVDALPEGGRKASGYGRDLGEAALDGVLETSRCCSVSIDAHRPGLE